MCVRVWDGGRIRIDWLRVGVDRRLRSRRSHAILLLDQVMPTHHAVSTHHSIFTHRTMHYNVINRFFYTTHTCNVLLFPLLYKQTKSHCYYYSITYLCDINTTMYHVNIQWGAGGRGGILSGSTLFKKKEKKKKKKSCQHYFCVI